MYTIYLWITPRIHNAVNLQYAAVAPPPPPPPINRCISGLVIRARIQQRIHLFRRIVTQNVFSVARHQPKRTGIRGARTSPARILRAGARQRHRASNGADEDEDETAAVSVRQRAGYYTILVCAGVLLQRRRAEKSRSISKGETQHNNKNTHQHPRTTAPTASRTFARPPTAAHQHTHAKLRGCICSLPSAIIYVYDDYDYDDNNDTMGNAWADWGWGVG